MKNELPFALSQNYDSFQVVLLSGHKSFTWFVPLCIPMILDKRFCHIPDDDKMNALFVSLQMFILLLCSLQLYWSDKMTLAQKFFLIYDVIVHFHFFSSSGLEVYYLLAANYQDMTHESKIWSRNNIYILFSYMLSLFGLFCTHYWCCSWLLIRS